MTDDMNQSRDADRQPPPPAAPDQGGPPALGENPPHAAADDGQEELDPGSRALADALRLSFGVLKIVMLCVVAFFIYRGFYWVEQNEVALELRFGALKGGESLDAIRQPGPHWSWPYPVEEVVIIPSSGTEREIDINEFWYLEEQTAPMRTPRPPQNLRFGADGYSLTGSRSELRAVSAGEQTPSTDYNIIHTRWQLRYRITEPLRFFRELWPGLRTPSRRYDWTPVDSFLRGLVSESVILASANWDIENLWGRGTEQIGGGPQAFAESVRRNLTERLMELNVGVTAHLSLVEWTPPRQVKDAFDRATAARDRRGEFLQGARAQAAETVSSAQAAADVILARAEAYATTVTQAAAADAEYLEEVLRRINQAVEQRVPEDAPHAGAERNRLRRQLLAVTMDELYQETIRRVMAHADAAFVLNAVGDKPVQWRPMFSRDASLPPPPRERAPEHAYTHTPSMAGPPGGPR